MNLFIDCSTESATTSNKVRVFLQTSGILKWFLRHLVLTNVQLATRLIVSTEFLMTITKNLR